MEKVRLAIRANPELAEAHGHLGVALARQGKREEAIEEYRLALRIKPDLAEARTGLGFLLKGSREGRERLSRSTAWLSSSSPIWLKPIGTGFPTDRARRIRGSYRRVSLGSQVQARLRSSPRELGVHMMAQGKREEAIEEYRLALKFKPDLAEAHMNLGVLLGRQGKPADAIEEYHTGSQDPARLR